MYDFFLYFFVQKSLIYGIYNALTSFRQVRIYLEEKERANLLLNFINENEPKLTDWKRNVYNTILESVNEKQGKLFILTYFDFVHSHWISI